VLALNGADGAAVGAIAAQLSPGLQISNVELGLLVTVSSLVGALATVPVGILTDKTRRVRLLSVSVLLWGAAEAASGLATSYTMLVFTRLALGAVTATAGPTVASLTGDLFPPGERSRIYSFIITGELAGAGFGVVVAGLVSGWFGWRAGFIVLAVPSVVLAWVLYRHLPEPARGGQSRLEPGAAEIVSAEEAARRPDTAPGAAGATPGKAPDGPSDDAVLRQVEERGVAPDEGVVAAGSDPARMNTWQAVRYVLLVRTNVVIIVASSLGYFFLAGLRTFAVIYTRGHFGIGQGLTVALLAAVGAAAVLGLLVAGRTADRLLELGHLDARLVVGGVGYLAAAALMLPGLLSTTLLLSLPLLMLAAAALAAPNPPLDAARLDVVPAQLWGRAEGVRTAMRYTLEAFAPLLFGLVSEQFGGGPATVGPSGSVSVSGAAGMRRVDGLQVAFLLMVVPLAGAGLLLLLLQRRHYAVDVASAAETERRARAEGGRRPAT
jgi:predicted MFS family arabinose efflux permease